MQTLLISIIVSVLIQEGLSIPQSRPTTLSQCNVGFDTCNRCVGSTDCCGVASDPNYGVCKDENNINCPDGSTFVCFGKGCPQDLTCNYVNPECPVTFGKRHCWGTLTCTGPSCPNGYSDGMFCHGGLNGIIKVCSVLAPRLQPKQSGTGGVSVDCQVSRWSKWTDCDPNSGTMTRTRTVLQNPLFGGAECPPLIDTQDCSVDCKVTEWGEWGPCDNTTGLQTAVRQVYQFAKNNGSACPSVYKTKTCPVDCIVTSNWTNIYDCNKTTGFRTITRDVIQSPLNGGKECSILSLDIPCRVDCLMTEWSNWTICNSSNIQIRVRSIVNEPKNLGYQCPHNLEKQVCDVGCGENLGTFYCALNSTSKTNTTTCRLPNDLSVSIPNKKGYVAAYLQMNTKITNYTSLSNFTFNMPQLKNDTCGYDVAYYECPLVPLTATPQVASCHTPNNVFQYLVAFNPSHKKALVKISAKAVLYVKQ